LVEEKAVVRQFGSVRGRGRRRQRRKRSVDEAVGILWGIIDEAKFYMADPVLLPEEKRRWAKTLADTIGVLNKLLANMGEKELEGEDLATLLTRVPNPWQKQVARRALMWRSEGLRIDCLETWGLRRRFPRV
jgi:hypothetical protein